MSERDERDVGRGLTDKEWRRSERILRRAFRQGVVFTEPDAADADSIARRARFLEYLANESVASTKQLKNLL